MNTLYKYYKCLKDCRLADLNLMLTAGQKFYRELPIVETSRAIRAATNAQWIKEITKTEFEAKSEPKTKTE